MSRLVMKGRLYVCLIALFAGFSLTGAENATAQGNSTGDGGGFTNIWDDEDGKPCGNGIPLGRMICLPWNYEKQLFPELPTEASL